MEINQHKLGLAGDLRNETWQPAVSDVDAHSSRDVTVE